MLTAYTPGHFTQTKSKTKTQKQSSTDRSPIDTQKYTTLHSPAHYRKKKNLIGTGQIVVITRKYVMQIRDALKQNDKG